MPLLAEAFMEHVPSLAKHALPCSQLGVFFIPRGYHQPRVFLILQAIQFVDIPVMSSYLVLIAFLFVLINLVVDLLYFIVDPRLRLDSMGRGTH